MKTNSESNEVQREVDMSYTEGRDGKSDEKREIEDKTKKYDDDEILPDLDSDVIVFKDAFQSPQAVTIEGFKMNKWGKPSLAISHAEHMHLNGQLNISNQVYMQLKKKFGPKVSGWKGQLVTFHSARFYKEDPVKGAMEGWNIKLIDN